MAEPPPPYTAAPSGDAPDYNDKAAQATSHHPTADGYSQYPGQQYGGNPVGPAQGGIPPLQGQYTQDTVFAPIHGITNQPGYGSIGQPGHATYVTVIGPHPQCSEFPCQMTCPQCHVHVITNTEYVPGVMTWLACGVMIFFGCWLGCCLIPFCVDSCKDVLHTCPNCNCTVGVYKRL